jgi:hypothetical protein
VLLPALGLTPALLLLFHLLSQLGLDLLFPVCRVRACRERRVSCVCRVSMMRP